MLLASALGLSACGGGDSPTPSPAPSPAPTPAPAPSPAPAPAPTPAPAPAPSGGSAAECFNIAWHTPGTTAVLDYAITGAASGSTRVNMSISGNKTFAGRSGLLEIFLDQIITYTAPATLASAGTVPSKTRSYLSENGTVLNNHGAAIESTIPTPTGTFTTTTTVVYDPPLVNRQFTLAVGASNTSSTTATTTTSGGGSIAGVPIAGGPTTASESWTYTYLGQETITIPAGTFVACKFNIVINGEAPQTEWVGKGNGARLRYTQKIASGETVTLSLTSASRLNGAPIAP